MFHFVLEGSDESARVDEVLDQLAPAFSRTRFVRIRPSTPSPMLATLGATALPAMICFRKKRLGKWTQGLDDFGGVEGFDEEYVSRWLAGRRTCCPDIQTRPESPDPTARRRVIPCIPAMRRRWVPPDGEKMEDAEEDSDEEDLCGSCEPCPTCGRRYPHTHVRALRHGGGRAQDTNDGSDDEDSDFD